MMALRVHGFYGHVRRNDLRSVAMFAGFLAAFQIAAAVTLFLPLLFLDPAHAFLLAPAGYLERYVPLVLVFGAGLFLVRFLRHVASVRATVDFAFVDRRSEPRLCNIVEIQAIAAGLPPPKAGLIETPARNAFACGLGASNAVVVATRGLVRALDDDELAAVVAHEIAHIRHGDIRLLAAADVMMANLAWLQRRNPLRLASWWKILLCILLPVLLMLALLAGFLDRVALTLARISRLLVSASREYVADAEAVRMTHNPAALISALRRIEDCSIVDGMEAGADAMMIAGATEGPFATHPTIAERIAVLERLSGDMARAVLPRRDTRPETRPSESRDPSPAGASPRRPAPAGRRSLAARVNAGSARNILGLSKAQDLCLTVGTGVFAALIYLSMMLNYARMPEPGPEASRAGEAQRGLVRRLSSPSGPATGRCFATDRHGVGDRGLHAIEPPDPGSSGDTRPGRSGDTVRNQGSCAPAPSSAAPR